MRASQALVLCALLAAPAARAQPADDPTGLVLGARIGWGVPFGDVSRDAIAVGDVVERKIPVWLELGYRFGRHVTGEIYLELAPASVQPSYCAPDVSCEASQVRFGLAIQLRLAPGAVLDPWLGLGFGVEVLNATIWEPAPIPGEVEWRWAGVELPVVEAGIDLAVFDRLSLGPYVTATLARFTSVSQRPVGGPTSSGAIDDRATHGWLQAGLRAVLRL